MPGYVDFSAIGPPGINRKWHCAEIGLFLLEPLAKLFRKRRVFHFHQSFRLCLRRISRDSNAINVYVEVETTKDLDYCFRRGSWLDTGNACTREVCWERDFKDVTDFAKGD